MAEKTLFVCFMCLCFIHLSSAHENTEEKHYLLFKTTAVSKDDFISEATFDDRQILHYNKEKKRFVRNNQIEDDLTSSVPKALPHFKKIQRLCKTLSKCTDSQCPKSCVLQRMTGCELERFPNGSVKSLRAFDEYGFDGEDLLTFDAETMEWIEKTPRAEETKKKWDRQTERNQDIKWFLHECMRWISTYDNHTKSSPYVYIFARNAPDDHSKLILTCLATGFYPRDIEMNIRLDESILEHQTSTGVRPNGDGSFQMRISVKIDRSNEGVYDCVVTHSSLTEPASVKWEHDPAAAAADDDDEEDKDEEDEDDEDKDDPHALQP